MMSGKSMSYNYTVIPILLWHSLDFVIIPHKLHKLTQESSGTLQSDEAVRTTFLNKE